MAKTDTSGYERFSDVTERLDEIIASVRDKGTSLERSLDLFDEAIALGTRAVDLVDKAAFSPEERERLVSGPEDEASAESASEPSEGEAADAGASDSSEA
jgi:exonuclease VII small subunit